MKSKPGAQFLMLIVSCLIWAAINAFLYSNGVFAQQKKEARPEISGDPENPRRHERIRRVADLSDREAQQVYDGLKSLITKALGRADDPTARNYATWPKYNGFPYRSATHGQRFVNNYANEKAEAYGRFEKAGKFPEGAIIAKDSFSVTRDGTVRPGPLFVMEKMAPGFNYVSGDWRYSMVLPGGTMVGQTNGYQAARVEYCIGCHLAREEQDHLYFIPQNYRVRAD